MHQGVVGVAFLARCASAIVLLSLVMYALPSGASAEVPENFQESTAFSGLTSPTAVRFASDGRVFVAEKSGLIKVFDSLEDPTPTQFADLRTQVHNFWDRGLLGLALHPNFPATPYVYVLYTYDKDPFSSTFPRWGTAGATSDPCPTPPGPTVGGCVVSGRLSRLTALGNVMTGSEAVLVEDWCQQYPSHTVGTVAFGEDGNLYVSAGEGASFNFTDYGQQGSPRNPCGDPPVGRGGAQSPPSAEGGSLRSQDVRSPSSPTDPTGLDGTVIRVDPETGAGVPGNPLFDSADANARRIVATGFRNPFRFTIRPGTNELWIGDVGRTTWEEINRLPAGEARNFGWPCYEGAGREPVWDGIDVALCEQLYASTGEATDLEAGQATTPYYTYKHSDKVVEGESCPTGSSSIAGLDFYDGDAYPGAYDGALFFADYSRDCIWVMRAGADGLPDVSTRATFVSGAANPVDVQIGPDGALYYVDFDNGAVQRVEYLGDNQPPVAVATADPASGEAPLSVDFDGAGSSDPDPGQTASLDYAWDLDGDGEYDDSSETDPSHTYTQPGTYTARLKVTDRRGASDTDDVTIHAGNTPPVPEITSPTSDTTWRVGERVDFAGAASDSQQGQLPGSALDWELVMHHCPSNCHEHEIEAFPGVASGFLDAPDHEYPSHLELKLTATDAHGASAATSVELDPRTVDLELASSTDGVDLTLNSETAAAPFTRQVIEGSLNTISSASPQILGGLGYEWESWSDDGARTHDVTANSSATYTATFTNHQPVAVAVADPTGGTAPLTVDLDATGSSDPDPGDSIAYAWDLDGDGQYDDSSSPTPTHTFTRADTHLVGLEVTDGRGATDDDSATIVASNTGPTPVITAPAADATWGTGQEFEFEGHATDAQDGTLPASALDWVLSFDCPTCGDDVVATYPGQDTGTFTGPDRSEYPSQLELSLTATDSDAAEASTSITLDPRAVGLVLESSPGGLQLALNGHSSAAPFTSTVVEGSTNSLEAPSPQFANGTWLDWASWSDGGGQTHDVVAEGPATHTALFADPTPPGGGSGLPVPGVPEASPHPGLDLRVEAKKHQKPERLAVAVSCPAEPCTSV